jgi:hypothetical protein
LFQRSQQLLIKGLKGPSSVKLKIAIAPHRTSAIESYMPIVLQFAQQRFDPLYACVKPHLIDCHKLDIIKFQFCDSVIITVAK